MPVPSSPPKLSQISSKKEKTLTIAAEKLQSEEAPMSAASTIPDPSVSQEHRRLSFPGVAGLLIRLKRHRHASNQAANADGNLAKSHHIVSESGPNPVSHPRVLEEAIHSPPTSPTLPSPPSKTESPMSGSHRRRISTGSITFPSHKSQKRRSIPLDDVELGNSNTFVCSGAVNVPALLTAIRRELRAQAETLGANALGKEHWSCTICGPKHRKDGTFRVHIEYSACPLCTNASDPNKPVCLDKAKSVPGLMTVLKRTAV